jgi:small subunit ribosomal protein S6
MNNYETVFILTPVLSDAQMKEAVEKIKKILTSADAEIVNEENWGLRKLAYPVNKKSTGFYQLIEFKATPDVIDILETQFRRDERVIRFLTFRQDKFAAEYAAKRRSLKSSASSGKDTKKGTKIKESKPEEETIN